MGLGVAHEYYVNPSYDAQSARFAIKHITSIQTDCNTSMQRGSNTLHACEKRVILKSKFVRRVNRKAGRLGSQTHENPWDLHDGWSGKGQVSDLGCTSQVL
jgi:hypothetical protein